MNSNSVQGFQARLRSPYVFISVQFLLSNYLKEKKKKVKSGSDSKESACTMGNLSWILGSGRSPRERNGYPLKYSFFFFLVFLLGEVHGQRSLVGYSPWGHKESN